MPGHPQPGTQLTVIWLNLLLTGLLGLEEVDHHGARPMLRVLHGDRGVVRARAKAEVPGLLSALLSFASNHVRIRIMTCVAIFELAQRELRAIDAARERRLEGRLKHCLYGPFRAGAALNATYAMRVHVSPRTACGLN